MKRSLRTLTILGPFLLSATTAFPQTSGFHLLYTFPGNADGAKPTTSLTIGKGDVLYGTTHFGGPSRSGTIFSLTPPQAPGGLWTEDTLLAFDTTDGEYPSGSLAISASGHLFGTTQQSGAPAFVGLAFSLAPPATAGAPWTESVLYAFDAAFGYSPGSNIVFGLDGNLYGTSGVFSRNLVYALTPPATAGAAWTPHALYTFGSYAGDADTPGEGLLVGKGGVLYGTSQYGGAEGAGTVYSVTPPAQPGGTWTEQVLHSFRGNGDGFEPVSVLTMNSEGVLYGATTVGPYDFQSNGCGIVFSLVPPAAQGGAWVEHVLYEFQNFADGCMAVGGVVFGKDGILYGTTSGGGVSYDGTLYSLTPPATAGGRWTHTVLHSFNGSVDGANPETSLVVGADGTLYGTTPNLGLDSSTGGGGTLFAFKP